MSKRYLGLILLSILAFALLLCDLCTGAVAISLADITSAIFGGEVDALVRDVVLKIRLTRSLVAIMAGVSLSVAGLQMQTLFRNPMAGPYLLGVSSGAGLGVSLFLLGAPLLGVQIAPFWLNIGTAGAAWIGSAALLSIILVMSRKIKDIMVILVLGMMLSSAISSVIEVLQYLSSEALIKSFVLWGMGSLGDITSVQLLILAVAMVIGLLIATATIKPMNMLLLGENYARSMGLHYSKSRLMIFISTTILAGSVTAFCGPIGFVGIAVPHLARIIFATSDHRILLPASALTGAVVMLGCNIISKIYTLPINAITALVGIPIVIYILLNNRLLKQ